MLRRWVETTSSIVQRLLIAILLLVGLGLASDFTQTRADGPARPQPEPVPRSGHTSAVNDVAFSPDGRWLASGSSDQIVKLWEAATGRAVRTLAGHSNSVEAVAFSPDGRWLASGSWDKTVKLWEVATGREVRTLAGHSSWVEAVAFSPDGRWLASGGWDKMIKLWEVATGREVRTLAGHTRSVNGVAFRVCVKTAFASHV